MNDCAKCKEKYTCERSTFYCKPDNGRNDKPMKKLSKIINDILQAEVPSRQLNRHKLTPYEFKELMAYWQHLHEGGNLLVLNGRLKEILEKCGFEVLPLGDDGVGWFVK